MNEQERGLDIDVKHVVLILGLVFSVALAVVVGKKMSTEAMAVVVGVVCGVAASVPTSLLILVATARRDRQRREEMAQSGRSGQYPPVVVIQGGAPHSLSPGMQAGYWPAPPPGPTLQREFHVVGGDDFIVDG